ncbi:MAG: thioredoxin family protein [Candidatus Methanomethylophilaceae archaeon]|nr:thioredoxin family protein [Candidatus Methanomethylophilaceae archaeon]
MKASRRPVNLTDATFDRFVSSGKILVEFWAPWCNHCKRLEQVIDRVAGMSDGRIKVGKVNIDLCPKITERYQIGTVPTILIFRDGELMDELDGYDSGMSPKFLFRFTVEV